MINITHACNLNCHLCYLPERSKEKDLTLEQIKKAIHDYPGKRITLSGGEPTMREDITEILRYIHSLRKMPIIITNGVKLANLDYLKTLHDAGLLILNFSCNGFNRKTFLEIENADLLDIKMKGLENLRSLGIKTQLSITLAEGINEEQFGEAIKYMLKNDDFLVQVRARVATPIGRSFGDKTIFLSEFLNILAKEIDVTRDLLVDFWIEASKHPNYRSFPNPHVFALDYHHIMDIKEKGYIYNRKPSAELVLFSWPDKYNVDYEEIQALGLDILTNELEVINYWDGIIRNEKYNFI
jgi:MoaA/NifB/PqqE/SkfB family radical SAM enzyme